MSTDERRLPEGPQCHDGIFNPLQGCPRGRTDCTPVARRASPEFESYFCCGLTNAAPVPEDVVRLCVKSTHARGPVDLLVNFDDRDAIDAIAVLSAGLSFHRLCEDWQP